MPCNDYRTASQRKTVLIVEDNLLNLRFFRDLLEHHGYSTLTATQGGVGIELARQQRPDLIVLDIQLPDISGMEATNTREPFPSSPSPPSRCRVIGRKSL